MNCDDSGYPGHWEAVSTQYSETSSLAYMNSKTRSLPFVQREDRLISIVQHGTIEKVLDSDSGNPIVIEVNWI